MKHAGTGEDLFLSMRVFFVLMALRKNGRFTLAESDKEGRLRATRR